MYMKLFSILGVLALGAMALFASPVFADANCPGVGNDCPQTINNQGGAGGNASAAAAAAASATQSQSNTNVFVPTNVNTNQQGQAQGQHQGQIQGQAQGQRQSQNNKQTIAPSQTVNIGGDEVPAQAPAIFSPNLTSSPEACMGSVSGGGGAGFNGISFGFNMGMTWTNEQCQDRMNARELRAIGDVQAAREYLAASNPKIAEAYKRAGIKVAVNEDRVAVVVPAATVVPAAVKIEKRDESQPDAPKVDDGKKVSEVMGEALRNTQAQATRGVQGL